MDTKRTARELLERLPEDCLIDVVLYHLRALRRVASGVRTWPVAEPCCTSGSLRSCGAGGGWAAG